MEEMENDVLRQPRHKLLMEQLQAAEEREREKQQKQTSSKEMEFKFSCPHCGQHIAATHEYIGVQANCPTCSQPFEVPTPDAIQNAHDTTTPSRGTEVVKAKVVSSKEFADAVWELMQKSARECCKSLDTALGDAGIKLNINDQAVLPREIIIAHLWAIAKAISPDTKALDALDDRYFIGHYNLGATKEEKVNLAKAAETELQDRYATYYKASEADEMHARDNGENGDPDIFRDASTLFPGAQACAECHANQVTSDTH